MPPASNVPCHPASRPTRAVAVPRASRGVHARRCALLALVALPPASATGRVRAEARPSRRWTASRRCRPRCSSCRWRTTWIRRWRRSRRRCRGTSATSGSGRRCRRIRDCRSPSPPSARRSRVSVRGNTATISSTVTYEGEGLVQAAHGARRGRVVRRRRRPAAPARSRSPRPSSSRRTGSCARPRACRWWSRPAPTTATGAACRW